MRLSFIVNLFFDDFVNFLEKVFLCEKNELMGFFITGPKFFHFFAGSIDSQLLRFNRET